MMRKLNTEEFIEKAIEKHGNKYDYSKTIYIDNKIPITIIHNDKEYKQRPDSHLQGKCPEKEWKVNKGLDNFITDSIRIHGDKYNYTKSIYIRTSTKLTIICEKHGEFKQTPNDHLSGKGCPTCKESSGERIIRNFLNDNDIIYEPQYTFNDCKNINTLLFDFYLTDYNICIEYDGIQHIKPNIFFGGNDTFEKLKINDDIKNKYCKDNNIKLLRIKYTEHNRIESILFDYLKKYKKITQADKNNKFIEKSINKWGYKYNYNKVNYIDARTPVIITYKGIDFKQTPSKHLSGKLCELNDNALSKEEFVRRCNLVWGGRFNYDETIYINSYSKVKIYDNKNDMFVEQRALSHMNGRKYNLSYENFIFLANIIYDNKYDYTNFIWKNITEKINIICPEHGEFTTRAYDHLNTRIGGICNKCEFNKFNTEVMKFLDKHNISYYRQHKFEDCRNVFQLPFDFYIPSSRISIEFDGKQHYEPNNHFGGIEAFEKLRINDNIKNDYCEDNFIDLIRIKYNQMDDIVDILNKALINII